MCIRDSTVVWFTAGSTTYEFDVFLSDSSYEPVEAVPAVDLSLIQI